MDNNFLNTLILKRFCGDEHYPLQSAVWSIWDGRVFGVEMYFDEGTDLHEDTEYLAQEPSWELYFNVPGMKEEDVSKGLILEEKDNREDETHFYYCEHLTTENNRLEVLNRDEDRILARITGECCDVNYYDGSKGNNTLEITVWIDKE